MNKTRRNVLSKKVEELETLKSQLEDIKSEIEEVHDEEDDCYSNLPDGIQMS